MLGKLLKYELKATARYFVPLLATFGGITLLFKLFMAMIGFGNDPLRMTFSIFIVTIYVVAVIALFLMCFIISFFRFYKNFYTDEGYLSFTLPVSINLQILNKLLISIFWVVVSTAAFFLSIFIFLAGTPYWNDFFHLMSLSFQEFSKIDAGIRFLFITETLTALVLNAVASPLFIYLCITIGGLLPNHRLAASIGTYFLATAALSLVTNIFSSIFPNFMNFTGLEEFCYYLMPMMLIGCIIEIFVSFFLTRYLMERKTNL